MNKQQELGITVGSVPRADREMVDGYRFEPIRGQPMLRWAGKRPFTSTQYFPAQEKERHGEETDGWMECEHCGNTVQIMKYVKTRRIPCYQMKDCQVLVPLPQK